MPSDPPFISYAQNAEDVVLWRALGSVPDGTYVEVGANHPTSSSITRAFYDRGWSGVEIEPVTEFAEVFRSARPRDTVVQVAVTEGDTDTVTIHVVDGTGLSTLDDEIMERHRGTGWTAHDETVPARRLDDVLDEHLAPDRDVHFMIVDVEGSEREVLAGLDLSRRRPWVLVVEATAPNSTEQTHSSWEPLVLAAGYEFCLFDGLSRFFVATEHAMRLRSELSSPANPLDAYTTHHVVEVEGRLVDVERRLVTAQESLARAESVAASLTDQLVRWRGTVLSRWATAVGAGAPDSASAPAGHEVVRLRQELEDHRATVSWRVTAPLRSVQRRRLEGWR